MNGERRPGKRQPRSLDRLTSESLPDAFGPGCPGIRLFVSTTGPVIPPEERPRLFDQDFRSASSETVEKNCVLFSKRGEKAGRLVPLDQAPGEMAGLLA